MWSLILEQIKFFSCYYLKMNDTMNILLWLQGKIEQSKIQFGDTED